MIDENSKIKMQDPIAEVCVQIYVDLAKLGEDERSSPMVEVCDFDPVF
jgi:hypothetical protein